MFSIYTKHHNVPVFHSLDASEIREVLDSKSSPDNYVILDDRRIITYKELVDVISKQE